MDHENARRALARMSPDERAQLERALADAAEAAVAGRTYEDCMQRCADQNMAMMAYCATLGPGADTACAMLAEKTSEGCYKRCHEDAGIPHAYE